MFSKLFVVVLCTVTRSLSGRIEDLNARADIIEANRSIPLTDRLFQSYVRVPFDARIQTEIFRLRSARPIIRRHSNSEHRRPNQRPGQILNRPRRSSSDVRQYVAPEDLRPIIQSMQQQIGEC